MRKTLLVLASALALSTQARADVLFSFTQTGSTPPGALTASGTLSLSDAAFASGISVARSYTAPPGVGPSVDLSGTGITDLTLTVIDPPGAFAAYYRNFVSGGSTIWSVMLDSAPSGVPTGRIAFTDFVDGLAFNLRGAASFGSFTTELVSSPCSAAAGCSFTGTFALSATGVPEPASLALLSLALGALGVSSRGVRPTPRC